MKKTKQGKAWKIVCVIVCLLVIPVILFNLILAVKGTTNREKLPSVFGIAPTVVGSGSMSPEFEENDLVFIWQVDAEKLKEKEDIICFITKDGSFVIHRIERIETVDGEKRFYTKGDANNTEDPDYVLTQQIQGKYIGKVSKVGAVVLFLQTPYGLMLTIIFILMLFIAGEMLVELITMNKENKRLKEEIKTLKGLVCPYNTRANSCVNQKNRRNRQKA